jgi:hypothetical protein
MSPPRITDQIALEISPRINGEIKAPGKAALEAVNFLCIDRSDMKTSEKPDNRSSWIQTVIADSEEVLNYAIDETAANHRMLIQLKGILAIIKNCMNRKINTDQAENTLAKLRLTCEKQISMMAHLLSLNLDKAKEEEIRFDMVLEYSELWLKNKRGRATAYEKEKVASMSAEIDVYGENAMAVARDAEICAAVDGLKVLAVEFATAAQTL